MHCSGAMGTEQTASFTSTTSRVTQLSSSTGHGCSPCCLSSYSLLISSYPPAQENSAKTWRDRKKRKTDRKKDGATCSPWPVQSASRRQPMRMGNVCTALSGLHELYMMRYVKMLPVYCVHLSLSFLFAFFFFNSLLSSFTPSFSTVLSRPQSLLFFSVTKYSLVVKC